MLHDLTLINCTPTADKRVVREEEVKEEDRRD
jgi:hypothetical protein